jgi:hypothetical protein
LPKENHDEALKILKNLNKNDIDKRGGGGGQSWFSWMTANYDKEVKSAYEIFVMLGFDCVEHDNSVRLLSYDNKIGQEEYFLGHISGLLEGYIVWHGEDGERWKVVYGEDKAKCYLPETKWIETNWIEDTQC